jgi:chromate transporter
MKPPDLRTGELAEVAQTFLRLGTTAFGGPAAHLAMMEEEFVRRREWITHEEFADMIGAAALVPGPNSTEVAIHIGLRRAGVPGMIVAGACFIVPAALMVSAIAWVYVRYGALPSSQSFLYGVKPVVVAVVAQAIWLLVGKVVNAWPKRLVLAGSMLASLLGLPEVAVLIGSGVLLGANSWRKARDLRAAVPVLALLAAVAAVAALPLAWEAMRQGPQAPTATAVFLYFLKLGSVLYGSGYVLVAFLERDLVRNWAWLPHGKLLDAVAVGQFTPGPVFTTATFIGFLLAGPRGAVAGTVGIFLPSFVFVAIGGRYLPRLRESAVSAGFLDGVNAAALGLMTVVLGQLALDAVRDLPTAVIAAAALVLLLRYKLNSALLIVLGGLAGLVLSAF